MAKDAVTKERERVAKLRAQVREEKAKLAAAVTDGEAAFGEARLKAEGDRLQAELDALRKGGKDQKAAIEDAVAEVATPETGPNEGDK